MPNLIVDVNSWIRSACYPQGSFYPLSDDPSTRNRRITKPDFRPCSTCLSRSQAPLCLCTRCMISNHAEGTLGRLRYFLGGDRPSQTARLTLSSEPVRSELEQSKSKSSIPTTAPPFPKAWPQRVLPILCMCRRCSILSYSKAPWGLSV